MTPGGDRLRALGRRPQEMLTVVQHHEQTALAGELGQRVQRRAFGGTAPTHRRQHDVGDHRRVVQRGQRREPHAGGEVGQHLGGSVQGQSRLTDATDTGHGDDPRFLQHQRQRMDIALAADERRALLRQVGTTMVKRP